MKIRDYWVPIAIAEPGEPSVHSRGCLEHPTARKTLWDVCQREVCALSHSLWDLIVNGLSSSPLFLHVYFRQTTALQVELAPEFSAHHAIEQFIYNVLYDGILGKFN